jgi:dihydropyrimidinase
MTDLVLRGDRIVTPEGVVEADIAIAGGRIAGLEKLGSLAAPRIIDMTGRIVMPGGIGQSQCTCGSMPAPEGGQTQKTQPASVVSRAAIHGGTTMLIDFVRTIDGPTIPQAIAARDAGWAGACHTDYAFHLMVEGDIQPDHLAELGQAIRAGHPTVKIFTTDITPSRKGRMVDFGDIWEVFQVIAANQGLGVIHAEDNDIVMHMYGKLIREGRTSFHNMAEVHNALSEDLSFRRIIRLAESVPGTALYMLHTSAASGVAAIREARAKGIPIYGESLHQYMLYTAEDYQRPNGQIYHTYPSLKSPADQAALWSGTLDGSINCVATDELCCTLAQKTQGTRIDDTTGGNSGVEPRVALMYSEMVGRRGYSLERFTDLVSTNAARILGMYPRKGAITPGADADITALDPTRRRTITSAELHETDYTPWEGWTADAWPCLTLLRGKVVMQDGVLTGSLADGKWIERRINPAIIAAPVGM